MSDPAEALARRSYMMSEPHLSGYRVIIGFETLREAQDALQAIAQLPKATLPRYGYEDDHDD